MRSTRTTRVIPLATALALLAVVSLPLASVAQTSPVSSSLLVKLIDGLAPEQQAEVIARNGGIGVLREDFNFRGLFIRQRSRNIFHPSSLLLFPQMQAMAEGHN